MKRTKPVYYRKKTASLPEKKIKQFKKSYKSVIKPALKKSNLNHHIFSLFALFLAMLFIFGVIQSVFMYVNYVYAKEKYDQAKDDLIYWERVVAEHPRSPDVYYNAAIYAAKLQDNEKALMYLREAVNLDPEFEEAKELEKKLIEE